MASQEVEYLTVADVIALYEGAMQASDQVPAALVREDALQSAVHHPRKLGYYENAGLAEQAVELMLHIAVAHAWVDGNKRIATLSLYAFLARNGVAAPDEAVFRATANALVARLAAAREERPLIRGELLQLVESWGE